MNEKMLIEKAEQYLRDRNISFVPQGKVGRKQNETIEVVFPVPEALDETIAVADPPDVRVIVDIKSGEACLIDQM